MEWLVGGQTLVKGRLKSRDGVAREILWQCWVSASSNSAQPSSQRWQSCQAAVIGSEPGNQGLFPPAAQAAAWDPSCPPRDLPYPCSSHSISAGRSTPGRKDRPVKVQRMGQCPSNPSPARLRFLGSDHKPEHKAPSRSGTWQVPRDEGREVRIAWLSSLHTKSFPFSKLLTPLLHVLKFSMYIVPDTFMYTWFIPLIPFYLN